MKPLLCFLLHLSLKRFRRIAWWSVRRFWYCAHTFHLCLGSCLSHEEVSRIFFHHLVKSIKRVSSSIQSNSQLKCFLWGHRRTAGIRKRQWSYLVLQLANHLRHLAHRRPLYRATILLVVSHDSNQTRWWHNCRASWLWYGATSQASSAFSHSRAGSYSYP